MSTKVVISDFHKQYDAIRAVRTEVFLVEQQIPPELEYDDDDLICIHAVVWELKDGTNRSVNETVDEDKKPIGTARLDLNQDGRVGRVAVLKEHRRRGIGSLLMQALESEAKSRGLRRIWFHSQISALPFYQALGYQAYGEEYLEANIPHLSMEKVL